MSIFTVVSTAATIQFWGIEAAEAALHMALQVDQGAYLRKATASEVHEYWTKNEGTVYSGSEPSGNQFEAATNAMGELCLFATIDGERFEAFWESNPFEDVGQVQRQLIDWGYKEMVIYVEDEGHGEGEL